MTPYLSLLAALAAGGVLFGLNRMLPGPLRAWAEAQPPQRQRIIGAALRQTHLAALELGEALALVVSVMAAASFALITLGLPILISLGLVAGLIGAVIFFAYRAGEAEGRLLDRQLPVALQQIANHMASGETIEQALEAVVETAPSPVNVELDILYRRTRTDGIADAFDYTARRLGSRSFMLAASVVRVGTSSGGKLPKAIKALSETLVAIERLNKKIRTASAESRRAIWIMTAMAPVLAIGGLQVHIGDNPILQEPIALAALGTSAVLIIAAHFLAWHFARVRV